MLSRTPPPFPPLLDFFLFHIPLPSFPPRIFPPIVAYRSPKNRWTNERMGKRSSRPPPFPRQTLPISSSKTPGAVDDGRKERKSFESPAARWKAGYLFLQRRPTAAFSNPLLLRRLPPHTARAICTAEAGDRNGGKREDNEDCGAEGGGAAAVRGAVGGRPPPPLPPLGGGGGLCSRRWRRQRLLPPSLRPFVDEWMERGRKRA